MPEGHTLVLAAWRLASFAGKTVRAESVDPRGGAIARALDSATLGEPGARGKHLLWPLADGRTLHSHLRMQGSWRVFREGERWTKPARQAWLVLRSDALVAVQFNGPVLELLRPGGLALHPVLTRLGPDVLAPGFDPADAARRGLAASEDRAVAELLLDQRVACGLGNIAKSEALWACRIDPFAAPGALGAERLAEIYEAGRAWLTAGVQRGGDAPRRIYGQPACPRCHGRSARRAQGDDGRTTWWCPACQSSTPDSG